MALTLYVKGYIASIVIVTAINNNSKSYNL